MLERSLSAAAQRVFLISASMKTLSRLVNLIIEQGMGVCLRKTPPPGFLGRDRTSARVAASMEDEGLGVSPEPLRPTPQLQLRPASDHLRGPRNSCLVLMLPRFKPVAPGRVGRGGGIRPGFRGFPSGNSHYCQSGILQPAPSIREVVVEGTGNLG